MPGMRNGAAAVFSIESAVPTREFAFSEADFRILAQLAYEYAGIALSESKQNLVYGRLSRRLRALGLASFRDYCKYLDANPTELENFINSISTNHTKFFREAHHFEHFRTQVAAPFAQAASRRSGGRLRAWSAGCSTGEEPYSIALVLQREIRNFAGNDVRILATDIDTAVLMKAAAGEFVPSAVEEVPRDYRSFLQRAPNDGESERVTFDPQLKSLIAFRRLNLMETWPFKGLFDAIFCRNVMIYFDAPTKATLVEKFTRQLKPGGFLYIGHSESLLGAHPGLQMVGRTTYRRDA
jgi:chemotaxis protein methyltransferase CheR